MSNQLTLAITTIGDLLLENKISSTGQSIALKIPDYQRPYKWTAKNVNLLLEDIVQAMDDNKEVYRVGTLILHNEKGVYNIVDGQQRTITFALLLKVLNCETINFLNESLTQNDYNLHNVINNFRTVQRRLENFDDKQKLLDFIKSQCELIVVITYDLSEAFQFFDSQNARGKALYPHDLLKAYHLREMRNESVIETEKAVKYWEDCDQRKLSELFNEYLYRLKEWLKGNYANVLNEGNIDMFKGVSSKDNHPYAQFYKGAFAYADSLNRSQVPFVTGGKQLKPFQINTPVIAGKPFFEYTRHYFDLLADIKNNNKYVGHFINGNEIVYTLDKHFNRGTGNRITRLIFDAALLLYIDRFCPIIPSKTDIDYFEKFVQFAFVWAYSMRAQYQNVGWLVAQNYVMGTSPSRISNDFNIYKMIVETDVPNRLISELSDMLEPINANVDKIDEKEYGVYKQYLHFFKKYNFIQNVK